MPRFEFTAAVYIDATTEEAAREAFDVFLSLLPPTTISMELDEGPADVDLATNSQQRPD